MQAYYATHICEESFQRMPTDGKKAVVAEHTTCAVTKGKRYIVSFRFFSEIVVNFILKCYRSSLLDMRHSWENRPAILGKHMHDAWQKLSGNRRNHLSATCGMYEALIIANLKHAQSAALHDTFFCWKLPSRSLQKYAREKLGLCEARSGISQAVQFSTRPHTHV